MPVAPTREFCLSLFASKLEATIKGVGDIIGWKYDNHEVGPLAAAAKQSLLRLVPYIVPAETDQTRLYRFVLDHGDFGIHNMSIASDPNGQPTITSLYDWEAGCIVPAILSDPLMAVTVDLTVNGNGAPSIARTIEEDGPAELAEYLKWSRGYFQVLSFSQIWFENRRALTWVYRYFSPRHPNMNVLFAQEKMRATYGLLSETGEEKIQNAILGTWELGRRIDSKNWMRNKRTKDRKWSKATK